METSITEFLPSNVATASAANTARGNNELDQSDFLSLIVTQLQNQDPTNPADTSEFTSQLAQFSTVEGIAELNSNFARFADSFTGGQTTEAVNLVGRSVITGTNTGYLNEGSDLSATLDLPSATSDAVIFIQDQFGTLVGQFNTGSLADGLQEFAWDGTDFNGEPLEEGIYRISAEAVINGQAQSVPVYVHNEVESVVLDNASNSYELRLADGSSVDISEVFGIFQ